MSMASWTVRTLASSKPDVTANYDPGDPVIRDLQMRGVMWEARMASRFDGHEWIVWNVTGDGQAHEITRYVDGYSAWRDDAGVLHLR